MSAEMFNVILGEWTLVDNDTDWLLKVILIEWTFMDNDTDWLENISIGRPTGQLKSFLHQWTFVSCLERRPSKFSIAGDIIGIISASKRNALEIQKYMSWNLCNMKFLLLFRWQFYYFFESYFDWTAGLFPLFLEFAEKAICHYPRKAK